MNPSIFRLSLLHQMLFLKEKTQATLVFSEEEKSTYVFRSKLIYAPDFKKL